MKINNPTLVQEKEFIDSDTLRNLFNLGQKPNNKKNHISYLGKYYGRKNY